MSYPHYDLVQKAHQDLLNEGKIAPRSNQEEVEQDKGLITRRAAYYVNEQRDQTHGLLEKLEGNNSEGFSVDWIIRSSDGEGWDVATDDGTNALPVNGGPNGPDPARIASWRQPTAELAEIDDQVDPNPEPEPDDDTEEILDAINNGTEAVIAAVEAGTQAILNELHRIVDEAEETLKQVLVGYLIFKEDDEPPAEEDSPRVLLIKLLHHLRQPESLKKKGK